MQKVLKNRIITSVCALFMLICCAVLFAACGGPTTIYQADFSKADNNDFNSYEGSSVVVDTENKVAKIGVGTNKNNQGANTYFGNKTTKNTEVDFSKAVVTLNVKIDSKSMQDGQGFNWTVAVNEKVENSEAEEQKDESLNYAFKSERSVYIRKVGENVKVGYVWNGSSDEINQTATSNATAKILTDGNYDINFAFQTDENNVVTIKITVVNESGKTVFEEDNISLGNSVTNDATQDLFTDVKADELSGIRYGWFSWMSVEEIQVNSLTITQ